MLWRKGKLYLCIRWRARLKIMMIIYLYKKLLCIFFLIRWHDIVLYLLCKFLLMIKYRILLEMLKVLFCTFVFYVVLNIYDCFWPPNVHGTDMLDCHMTFINTFLHYNVKKKKKKLEKFCSETIKFKLYDDD